MPSDFTQIAYRIALEFVKLQSTLRIGTHTQCAIKIAIHNLQIKTARPIVMYYGVILRGTPRSKVNRKKCRVGEGRTRPLGFCVPRPTNRPVGLAGYK